MDSQQTKGLLKEIFKMEKELLFQIIGALKEVTISKKEERELRKPLTNNLDALFDFFAAVDYSDKNNHTEARRYYRKALRNDPSFGLAKESLMELEQLGLVKNSRRHNLTSSLRSSVSLPEVPASEDIDNERNPEEARRINNNGDYGYGDYGYGDYGY